MLCITQRVLLGAAGHLNPAAHQAPQLCFELRLFPIPNDNVRAGSGTSSQGTSGGSNLNNHLEEEVL